MTRIRAAEKDSLHENNNALPCGPATEQSGIAKVVDVGFLIDGRELFGVSIVPVDLEPRNDGPTGTEVVVANGDSMATQKM